MLTAVDIRTKNGLLHVTVDRKHDPIIEYEAFMTEHTPSWRPIGVGPTGIAIFRARAHLQAKWISLTLIEQAAALLGGKVVAKETMLDLDREAVLVLRDFLTDVLNA
jgi:hypothetical protein